MHLRFSKLALGDLTLIHDYTLGERGEEQAVKYVNALWDALEEISAAPERWRLRPDIFEGCRTRVCAAISSSTARPRARWKSAAFMHGAMNLRDHVPRDFMGDG